MKKLLISLSCLVAASTVCASQFSEKTRSDYKRAYAQAIAGDSRVISKNTHLQSYPLWPDLQAAHYRGQLGKTPDATIQEFIRAHGEYSSVGQLRYRWMKSLAKRKQWRLFKEARLEFYADTTDDVLLCLDAQAGLNSGGGKQALQQTLDLWMSGSSRPDECDPAFKVLNDKGWVTHKRLRQRIDLALDKGNTKLARFLAKQATSKDIKWVDHWTQMRRDPLAKLNALKQVRNSKANRELLLYGIKRAARRDPQATYAIWPGFRQRYKFSAEEQLSVDQGLALSAARDRIDVALPWLKALPAHTADTSVWLIRRALAAQDWPTVYEATFVLPEEDQKDETWLYWRARALEAMGQRDDAYQVYSQIAGQRAYYGFLAADRIEQPYQFNHQSVAPDEPFLIDLGKDPRLVRAYELYKVNLHGFGRSEWDRAVRELTPDKKQQAAILAHRWGWHSRTIATIARTSANDLILSHPMPYQQQFEKATRRSGIDTTWAYGIARSESLFMPDVRSRANAYGLMQLLPSTGRRTAQLAHIPYRGRSTLLDPDANITLGTHYLGQIFHQLGNNQVLATAGYNAGPHRVKSWLPEDRAWHADIWVENIPFTETRRYVKRVLTAQAITHWRMTGMQQRLASMMPPIESKADRQNRLARK